MRDEKEEVIEEEIGVERRDGCGGGCVGLREQRENERKGFQSRESIMAGVEEKRKKKVRK